MAGVLSIPFRITKNGEASKVEQGSDSYYSEQLAVLLMTGKTERVMQPTLGMPDMAFDGFLHSAFHTQVTEFLPELQSVSAEIVKIESDSQTVVISFNTKAGA